MADAANVSSETDADMPGPTGNTPPPAARSFADIREVLLARGDLAPREAADLLLADQMARWERGERVPVEAYLQLHPTITPTSPDTFDLVFNEYVLRQEPGRIPFSGGVRLAVPPFQRPAA